MQWLIDKLLGIDRVALGEGEWSVFWRNPPLIWFLLLVITPLVFLGTYYFYRKETTPIAGPVRFFLIALRCLLIFLILAIIFEPVLMVETMSYHDANLVVLQDDSLSMGFEARFTDPEQRAKLARLLKLDKTPEKDEVLDKISRLDLVSGVFSQTYPSVLGKLAEQYKVKLYTFSTQLMNKELPDITKLKPSGDGTAIGDALTNIINILAGESLAGIILISDGQNNVGSDPLQTVNNLVTQHNMPPVYTISAGSEELAKEIELHNLNAPPVAVVNDFVQFKCSVKSKGFNNETVPIILKEADKEVARDTLTLLGDGREQEVILKYKPLQPGEYICEMSIPFQKGELTKENNILRHHLKVIDEKIKVLYIESYPRWEYRALKNALIRDRTVQAHCWLVESDPEFPQEASPGLEPLKQLSLEQKDLFKYDVIIIGDVAPRHLADPIATGSSFTDVVKIMDNITTFVEKMGGGIAFIAGERYNPRTFKNTAFADLLPAALAEESGTYGPAGSSNEPFRLKLTPLGKASRIMHLSPELDVAGNTELVEDQDQKGDGLPEFWWFYPVRQPKPAAEVLATHSRLKNKHGLYPIFTAQWVGNGRVFFSAVDETWRWRAFYGDLYFYTFWSEVIRDLRGGKLRGDKRYNILVDKAVCILGDKIKLSAQIYDEDFKPLEMLSQPAYIELPGGTRKELDLKPLPNKLGLYEGSYKTTETGNHWAWVGPEGLGQEKERASVSFTVNLPTREYANTEVDVGLLKQIAEKTKGAYIPLYKIDTLLKEIKPIGKVVFTETREDDLWDSPFFFLLFLIAITIEWIIRKLVRLL